jgi:hypothetical protein
LIVARRDFWLIFWRNDEAVAEAVFWGVQRLRVLLISLGFLP